MYCARIARNLFCRDGGVAKRASLESWSRKTTRVRISFSAIKTTKRSIMSEEKPIITFDDFSKLDIRVGTIIVAEKVENSQKLLRLVIDFGYFKRQVIAGIASKYSPEYILEKQIPVVINLAPRKMAGLVSQGMILAIGDAEVEALLFPTEKVTTGASVH